MFGLHLTKNNIFSFLKIAFCTVMRLLKLHYLTSFVWPNSCFTNIKTFSVMGLPTHATHIRDRKVAQNRCKQKTKLWWNDWYLVSTILEDSRQFLYSSYQFVCSAVLLEYYHYENSCLNKSWYWKHFFCFYRKSLYVSKTLIRNKSIV